MGMRTLNRKVLEDDPFLRSIFGSDHEDDEDDDDDDVDDVAKSKERPKPGDRRRVRTRRVSDDDDDDDLDGIEDPSLRRIAELSRESARRRREKNQEKKRADELQAELDKIKNSGKSDEEQRNAEIQALTESNTKLQAQLEKSIVRAAIANNSELKWHDLDEVFAKLDIEDLEIDLDSGDVDGLEAQLKSIAKKKPYLLKESSSSDEDNGRGRQPGSTGHNPRGTGARNTGVRGTKATQRDELMKKYKSLTETTPV